jgi:hypothetical protein
MSDALMKAKISEKTGNVVMCKMRMMYANLITPGFPSKNERRPEKKQWQVTGLIPVGSDVKVLEEEIERVIKDNLTPAQRAKTKIESPIKETAKNATLAALAEEYPYFIRTSAKCFDRSGKPRPRPDVVDNKGNTVPEIEEADQLYNGRWFRPSLQPYWYDNENQGVSLGLANVQLLAHAEPLAGGKASASADFEPVEDEDLAELEDSAFE